MHLIQTRTLAIVGLALVLGSGPGWAGPPDPTLSDANGYTAGGSGALTITTGLSNTAFGDAALVSDTTGTNNTASGLDALRSNTTGNGNTASGYGALLSNTTGGGNTASGLDALRSNTTGVDNNASGYKALYSNTTGSNNTASGYGALYNNTTGNGNTASGDYALPNNTMGYFNTASGYGALYNNTTGNGNTASGDSSGESNTTGAFNTFIGYDADANAGNYTNGTTLGYGAVLTASNSIVLGNASISKIYANVTSITAISDRRRKKDIRVLDTGLGLDFIEKLQPVSYRFNDGDETERYGFIAQDLEAALPASLHGTIEKSQPEHGLALIERQNDKDRTYRVSYGELFAPIVKALQQQQQQIAAERRQTADLRHALDDQAVAFKAEAADLRRSIDASGCRSGSSSAPSGDGPQPPLRREAAVKTISGGRDNLVLVYLRRIDAKLEPVLKEGARRQRNGGFSLGAL